MAAKFGAASLAELHHEGLAEILHDLAGVYFTDPDQELKTLGVPVLDALLEIFMQKTLGPSTETQRQHGLEDIRQDDQEMLFTRDDAAADLSIPTDSMPVTDVELATNLFLTDSSNKRKRPNPVIEISSSLSGAGKTHLLYYLVAFAILPQSCGNIPIGGRNAAVVFIDTDDRFDSQRLYFVARGAIERAAKDYTEVLPDEDAAGIVTSALKHVHVFRPQSSTALLSTLHNLNVYLYDLSRHHSASRSLQLLVIDSATAFLWQDRLRDEIARTEDIGRPRAEVNEEREQGQSFYFYDLYGKLVNELKRLQSQFNCTVVFTTTVSVGRPPTNSTSGQFEPFGPSNQTSYRTPALRPALPAPWGTFPILRLVVQRDTVRSFPPTLSTHDAESDATTRQDVVHQGKFSAWVNAWGREEWPRRVVDAVDWHNGGSFPFYVREAGVVIPPA